MELIFSKLSPNYRFQWNFLHLTVTRRIFCDCALVVRVYFYLESTKSAQQPSEFRADLLMLEQKKKIYYYFHLQVSPTRCLVSRDQNVKKKKKCWESKLQSTFSALTSSVVCLRCWKGTKSGTPNKPKWPVKDEAAFPAGRRSSGQVIRCFQLAAPASYSRRRILRGNIREQTACSLRVCVGGRTYTVSTSAGERWMIYEFWAI